MYMSKLSVDFTQWSEHQLHSPLPAPLCHHHQIWQWFEGSLNEAALQFVWCIFEDNLEPNGNNTHPTITLVASNYLAVSCSTIPNFFWPFCTSQTTVAFVNLNGIYSQLSSDRLMANFLAGRLFKRCCHLWQSLFSVSQSQPFKTRSSCSLVLLFHPDPAFLVTLPVNLNFVMILPTEDFNTLIFFFINSAMICCCDKPWSTKAKIQPLFFGEIGGSFLLFSLSFNL